MLGNIACKKFFLWGTRDEQIDAHSVGNVCLEFFKRPIIWLTVCAVAKLLPAHRICKRRRKINSHDNQNDANSKVKR